MSVVAYDDESGGGRPAQKLKMSKALGAKFEILASLFKCRVDRGSLLFIKQNVAY